MGWLENLMDLGCASAYRDSMGRPRHAIDAFAWWSMPPPAVEQAAGRIMASSLCCAVEVCGPVQAGGPNSWEPRLIVLRGQTSRRVIDAVADTMRSLPGHGIRITGYEPSQLTPVDEPPPVVCLDPPVDAVRA
jgi:hypothetical protein